MAWQLQCVSQSSHLFILLLMQCYRAARKAALTTLICIHTLTDGPDGLESDRQRTEKWLLFYVMGQILSLSLLTTDGCGIVTIKICNPLNTGWRLIKFHQLGALKSYVCCKIISWSVDRKYPKGRDPGLDTVITVSWFPTF